MHLVQRLDKMSDIHSTKLLLLQDVYFTSWLALPLNYTSGSQCKYL